MNMNYRIYANYNKTPLGRPMQVMPLLYAYTQCILLTHVIYAFRLSTIILILFGPVSHLDVDICVHLT